MMSYLVSALIGIASWYGPELEGNPTASGEPFDPTELTAASWHYPLGTVLEVTNSATDKKVVVRVNDRGPARRLDRVIDLSQASFAKIADLDQGLVTVEVKEVPKEEDDDEPDGQIDGRSASAHSP